MQPGAYIRSCPCNIWPRVVHTSCPGPLVVSRGLAAAQEHRYVLPASKHSRGCSRAAGPRTEGASGGPRAVGLCRGHNGAPSTPMHPLPCSWGHFEGPRGVPVAARRPHMGPARPPPLAVGATMCMPHHIAKGVWPRHSGAPNTLIRLPSCSWVHVERLRGVPLSARRPRT